MNDLTSWLKLEATDIFQTPEEADARTGEEDVASSGGKTSQQQVGNAVKGTKGTPPSRRNSFALIGKKILSQNSEASDLAVSTDLPNKQSPAETQTSSVADDVDSSSPLSSEEKSPLRDAHSHYNPSQSYEHGDLIHPFHDVEFPSFNYFDHPSTEFYLYSEEEHPEEFFVPYTWSIVVRKHLSVCLSFIIVFY